MKQGLLSIFLTLSLTVSATAQEIPVFRDGEKVAFVGNSITHGGHYHSYIWLYYMTRFPEKRVTLYNCGVGGDTAGDILRRWDKVDAKNPTYITLTFGMNDTGYWGVYDKDNAKELSEKKVKESLGNFAGIVKKLDKENPDVDIVMIGGSPYDETSKCSIPPLHGKNAAMQEIGAAQKDTAEAKGWGFVDFNAPMVEIAMKRQQEDSAYTFCPQDRIHPDKDGQMVMAYLFLKAQGLSGKKVAGISLDAKKKKVLESDNCSLSGFKWNGDGVSMDYLAKALPYPCDSIAEHGWGNIHPQRDAMGMTPFMKDFNEESLKIARLPEGDYVFKIDGQVIDTLSAEKLSAGVNMAEYNRTPQYLQASEIMYLNEERFDVEKRFREYEWMENYMTGKVGRFNDDEKALEQVEEASKKDMFVAMSYYWFRKSRYPEIRAVWQKYMDDIVDKIYELNKPVTHRISVERIK